jgi:leader peptidase (prepilin peptidase)/N-methyltransferase
MLIVALLITAAATDLAHRRIYRPWSATALTSGLLLALAAGRWSHLIVALVLFAAAYILWRGGGIGGGDVWLAAYLGLALGPRALLALLLGSALGSVIALALVAARRMTLQDPVPLGLFWAVGGVIVVISVMVL